MLEVDDKAESGVHAAAGEFIASSNEWADEEPDDDDKQDFFPPIDADLSKHDELDESNIREAAVPQAAAATGSRRR